MGNSQNKHVWIIGVLVAIAVIILAPTFIRSGLPAWWPSKPMKLGLDIRGGSYLILGVQTEEAVKSQLSSIAIEVRNELKKERVGLLKSRRSDDRSVEITLTSDKGMDRVDSYMNQNYPYMLRGDVQRGESNIVVGYKMREEKVLDIKKNTVIQAIETVRNRVDQYNVSEPTISRYADEQIMVQLPDVTDLSGVKETMGRVARLDFRLVADTNKPLDETIELKSRDGGTVRLDDEVLMTGAAVSRATVDVDSTTNSVEVNLELNETGRNTFDSITSNNINRQLAIILDNVVQSSPVIRDRISGGRAQITGRFSMDEAHRLAMVLRAGALPAPLTFEQQRTVGASLGADSINKGITASLVGSLVVILFMIAYYRKAGALAILTLTLNMLFLLAGLAVLGATLTLPGIAGLALTVGMAVDANVIIHERIREELKKGASIKAAIDAGFEKVHWTILDSNFTTLIAGIILYACGSGPIRGFAVTLSIGILSTIVAALYFSRVGFNVFKLRDSSGNLSI